MTAVLDNKIDELIARVKNHHSLTECCFIPAYPPRKTPNPIKKYTVTVANDSVRMSRIFIGGNAAEGVRGFVCEVELRMRVYAPERTSGSALLRVTSLLMDALESQDRDRAILSMSLSGISFDSAARVEYRDVVAKLSYLLCGEAES